MECFCNALRFLLDFVGLFFGRSIKLVDVLDGSRIFPFGSVAGRLVGRVVHFGFLFNVRGGRHNAVWRYFCFRQCVIGMGGRKIIVRARKIVGFRFGIVQLGLVGLLLHGIQAFFGTRV